MSLPENYISKLISYTKSLKVTQMPLLSWDIHMQHLDKLKVFNKDLNFIRKFEENSIINAEIAKEYEENNVIVVITDVNLNIEFASSNMLEMAGYKPIEIIGKSPKMFQGPKTDKLTSSKIRKAIDKEEAFDCTIVNYKKDNTTYNCHIKGYPVYNKKRELINFIAIEKVA